MPHVTKNTRRLCGLSNLLQSVIGGLAHGLRAWLSSERRFHASNAGANGARDAGY